MAPEPKMSDAAPYRWIGAVVPPADNQKIALRLKADRQKPTGVTHREGA
jgi:hypothetical protein